MEIYPWAAGVASTVDSELLRGVEELGNAGAPFTAAFGLCLCQPRAEGKRTTWEVCRGGIGSKHCTSLNLRNRLAWSSLQLCLGGAVNRPLPSSWRKFAGWHLSLGAGVVGGREELKSKCPKRSKENHIGALVIQTKLPPYANGGKNGKKKVFFSSCYGIWWTANIRKQDVNNQYYPGNVWQDLPSSQSQH